MNKQKNKTKHNSIHNNIFYYRIVCNKEKKTELLTCKRGKNEFGFLI